MQELPDIIIEGLAAVVTRPVLRACFNGLFDKALPILIEAAPAEAEAYQQSVVAEKLIENLHAACRQGSKVLRQGL
jgi:hypothetical protein